MCCILQLRGTHGCLLQIRECLFSYLRKAGKVVRIALLLPQRNPSLPSMAPNASFHTPQPMLPQVISYLAERKSIISYSLLKSRDNSFYLPTSNPPPNSFFPVSSVLADLIGLRLLQSLDKGQEEKGGHRRRRKISQLTASSSSLTPRYGEEWG